MPSSELHRRTLDLVRNRPITCTYKILSKNTQVPALWIKYLVAEKLKTVDVGRCEALYVYLNKSPLFPEV